MNDRPFIVKRQPQPNRGTVRFYHAPARPDPRCTETMCGARLADPVRVDRNHVRLQHVACARCF